MSQRRSTVRSTTRTATHDVFDRVTLITFVLTTVVAATVVLDYGPAAALNHITDVLAAAGTAPIDPAVWQGAVAY